MNFDHRQKKLPGWMSPSYLYGNSKRRRWKGKNPNNPFNGNSEKKRTQSKSWEDSGWKLLPKPRPKQ